MNQEDTIFIQIASYRDPQLLPTIKDCIKNAKNPQNLHFCVAWQFDEDERLKTEKDLLSISDNIKIIHIPYKQSKGACWARNLIQQNYNGETYTLQLDSHHRFVDGWDVICIDMINQLKQSGVKKPLLTAYLPSFNPSNDGDRCNIPWKMDFDRFIPEGAVFFRPSAIDDWMTRTAPVPSRFYSAHFCFTDGVFCKEVQHDPNYYFHGEEISIAVRAYTHGYDLFHPHKLVAWHEYTRVGRTKHWDDHNSNNKNDIADNVDWVGRNLSSHARNRVLFSMDGEKYESIDWGIYGFGTERTLLEYEKYAGIVFETRGVLQEVIHRKYPDEKRNAHHTKESLILECMQQFKHCIDLHKSCLEFPVQEYSFIAVILEDVDGRQIDRRDYSGNDLMSIFNTINSTGFINIWRDIILPDSRLPKKWVVWPHHKTLGWSKRIVGSIG